MNFNEDLNYSALKWEAAILTANNTKRKLWEAEIIFKRAEVDRINAEQEYETAYKNHIIHIIIEEN